MTDYTTGPGSESTDNESLSAFDATIDDQAADDVDDGDAPMITGKVIGVTMIDGRQFSVTVRNRDYLDWDLIAPRRKWQGQAQPFIFGNFLAWSAARREGQFDGTFDGREPGSWWNAVADIDQSATATTVPPTRPAAAPR